MWDIEKNVPQTFPIIIKRGNRNKIYEIMNEQGYGVVSLYHTMIEELKIDQHADACWLSGKIMNLTVHQDCDSEEYPKMVEALKLPSSVPNDSLCAQ
jgi:dTDP-4-amino-4,6-dideoxygalactose transaminase